MELATVNKTEECLYHVVNDIVFFFAISESKPPVRYGVGLQKLHDVGRLLIESVSIALNQADIKTYQGEYEFVNQDTVRDNFSSITLLIDSIFDGTGGPGGAVPNILINSQCDNQIATEMLKKGMKDYGSTQDILIGSTQNSLG